MKSQKVVYVKKDEDTTMTLKILVGETFDGSMVTEKLSIDLESGEEYTHFTLETMTTEDQVLRTLEELAAETEEDELLDDLPTQADPASDALELELLNDDKI